MWHIARLKNANSHALIFFKERQISRGRQIEKLMDVRDYIKSLLPIGRAGTQVYLIGHSIHLLLPAAVTGIGTDPPGSSFPSHLAGLLITLLIDIPEHKHRPKLGKFEG